MTNGEASFIAQVIGIVAVGAFVGVVSAAVWLALKATIGLRPTPEDELRGLDLAEIGVEAYPEFGRGGQKI